MKKLIGLFTVLLLYIPAFSQWIQQNSNTTKMLRSVCFTDENHGFVVGDSGTILKTEDGGSVWTPVNSGVAGNLNSVDFPDDTTGFIVGDNGVILKSIDGGITWTLNYSDPSLGNLHSVRFPEVLKGYVSANGNLMITLDGGSIWYILLISPYVPMLSASWTDTTTGYLVGVLDNAKGFIKKMMGEGLTILPESESGLYSVFFYSDSIGYAAGMNGTFVRTIDAGNTWTTLHHNTGQDYYSVFFTESHTGYVAGSGGTIKKTIDGGINWILSSSGVTAELRELYFINSDTGYAVGANGTILKTNSGGIVSVKNNSDSFDFTLYPNPATNKIIIVPEVQVKEQIKVSILDLYGKTILEKVFHYPQPYEIDVSSLPGGLHLIKIESKSGCTSRKLVIARKKMEYLK